MRPESGSQIARNWSQIGKMTITSQFSNMTSSSIFLTLFCLSCQVCYWSKFHVNIITGSGVMTIFFYNWLSRNPEIRNTPIWVLPNIWRLGQFRDAKFDTNVSNKMLLGCCKIPGFLLPFLSYKRKTNEWGGGFTPCPTPSTLGLKGSFIKSIGSS